ALWSLGLGEPWPVSALHGRGSGDMLDAVLEALPPAPRDVETTDDGPRRVALVGRPNVGKSSLLNKLAGSERSLVHDVAGTTRDPVDELVTVGGEVWKFIDTAGLRRRVKEASGAEYYSSLRTAAALEAAEVAIVLLAADEPLSEQDQRVISMVIAFNKWDLVDEDRRYTLDKEILRDLARVTWAQRVNVSAKTGRATDKLAPALRTALESWGTRVPTGRLNAWLADVTGTTPPPARGGKIPRILFATQAGTRPPRFVIFATGFLEPSYRRFLERRLREDFGFTGTPIEISIRVRERGERPRS
nr:GTP-binding protein [Micromonospora sp. DSM 115978]